MPVGYQQSRDASIQSHDLAELRRPALLLGPVLLIVGERVRLELGQVGGDHLLAAVCALFAGRVSITNQRCIQHNLDIYRRVWPSGFKVVLTMAVGLAALTGRPLGLTAARVPAASAFLCSRWICMELALKAAASDGGKNWPTLAFLETGMFAVDLCWCFSGCCAGVFRGGDFFFRLFF